ncbi:ATP-binding protein [Pseudalkalibacillus salsuginis]|uniref:ATP-binding protein n=1 Tax=Pseudalkalibacillus salsuginis TaxID=2910972 RepID=UPI001F164E67|nr:ATP-binding protein [Pseudalkalibacillus salsuginis]MCF6411673.1 ATP-binding protein [Pseudalkalibacillus salsuginis]
MRNAIIVPFNEDEKLIITSDNSGSVGEKDQDDVIVPYDVVSYYSFRVAVMECMASGGIPISVVIHNFCGDEVWRSLEKGVEKGLSELELDQVEVTGSTESNFSLNQSAVGVVVMGRGTDTEKEIRFEELQTAVIGSPLVGSEVIAQNQQVAPLSIFNSVLELEDLYVWPVGSKGIRYELSKMNSRWASLDVHIESDVDLAKSAGPATCFIVSYPPELDSCIRDLTGILYHPLIVRT